MESVENIKSAGDFQIWEVVYYARMVVIMGHLRALKERIYNFALNSRLTDRQTDGPINNADTNNSGIFNKQSSAEPEFSGSQVRLVLYRDQDFKGRSLLFDSKAVHRVDEHDAKGIKKMCGGGQRACSEEPEQGGPAYPKYACSRPGSDTKMLEEMSFGAVGMAFRGSTLKVHTIRTPPQLMFTKVFVPTLNRTRESCGVEGESLECSLNYCSSELAMPQRITTSPSQTNPSIAQSVPMDVPSPQTRLPYSDHEPEDSGFSTSAASSLSSLTASIPRSTSSSSLNSSSYNSMSRRWRRSQQTSLEHSFLKRQSDEGVYEHPVPATKKPCKVGLAVVISLSEDDEENSRLFQNFFFSHITLIECHMEKLKLDVECAMSNRKNFLHLMMEALNNFRQLLVDLYLTPRLPEPVWLNMMYYTTQRVSLCQRFLRELMVAVTKYDTKQTKFFLSTLLTGVLTNHLAWVPTVTPAGATPSGSYMDKHSAKWLDAVAKSHPYNPLWAQLGDLYGALGFPLRLTRTVVVGKKTDMVSRFLYILSYFIRCSEVLERSLHPYDFDGVDLEADISGWSESSTDSVNAAAASQSAGMCTSKCRCGLQPPTTPISPHGMIGRHLIVCTQCQANRATPDNSFSSGSRLVDNGSQLISWPESLTVLPQTDKAHVKLKHGFVSGVAIDPVLGAVDSRGNVDSGGSASKGIVVSTCGGAVSSVWPSPQKVSSFKNSSNVTTPLSATPACMPVVQQANNVVPSKQPSAANANISQKASMNERHSPEILEANSKPKAPVEGDNEVVMCRMSPICISEEPNTERIRHVGRQASDRSSASPISGLHQVDNASVGVKGETNQIEAVLNEEKSTLMLTESGSGNNCDNSHLVDDCLRTTAANCDINENNPETKMTELREPQGAKYEYSHDSGMYDTVVLPTNTKCDPAGDPTTDSELFQSTRGHPPLAPSTDTIQDLQEENTPKKELLYHVPPSFQHSNSMFDEYFTEVMEPAGRTENLPSQPKRTPGQLTRMCSIEGSSSIFDEYMNVPCPDISWRPEPLQLSLDSDQQDMFDEYFSSIEFSEKPSEDDNACKHGKNTAVSSALSSAANTLSQSVHLADRREAPRLDCLVLKPVNKDDDDSTPRPRHLSGLSSTTLTPARTSLVTPTELSRCRHASSLSSTSSIEVDFFTSLKEVDMPACDHIEETVSGPQSFQRNFGRSLLAGTSPHYLSDFVLHGTTDNNFQAALHNDLTMTVKNSVLDEQMSEAVCIVANTDNWTVKLQKCHYDTSDRVRTQEVAASPLVCNIMESVHNLWKLKMSPEFCLMHLEDRLQEIYFKSRTLAECLRLHKRIDIKQLADMLKFDVNDIPLLMAVAGTHTPLMSMALL